MEILGKLGSALEGFWWALDDRERQMLFLGVWLTLALALGLTSDKRHDRDRQELVHQVADELEARRAR